ncbi:MAG: LbtU family siderophore porin [bacterium]
MNNLSLGGHIHTTATSLSQDFQNGNSDDTTAIDVQSAALSLTSSPSPYVDGKIVWLLEEGLNGGSAGQGFAVDQAYVTVGANKHVLSDRKGRSDLNSPYYAKIGKFYSPFGISMGYHTFDVISEPETLALAETLESGVQFGYKPHSNLNAFLAAYNGGGPDGDNDQGINDVVLGLHYSHRLGKLNVEWTNNQNNSLALQGELTGNEDANAGYSAYASTEFGPAQLQVSYVAATDQYDTGGLVNEDPSALTAELTMNNLTKINAYPVNGTLVYDQTSDWPDHPENVYGAVVDVPVVNGATVSAEFLQREYDESLTTRLDEENLIAVRFSMSFSELLQTRSSK